MKKNTEIEVKKFKKLIKEMYEGFPNIQFRKKVEDVVVTDEMRKQLIDAKYLVREPYVMNGQESYFYMIGPNALALVSAWETEELTKSIKKLTWAVIIMTGVSLFFIVIQTLKMLGIL